MCEVLATIVLVLLASLAFDGLDRQQAFTLLVCTFAFGAPSMIALVKIKDRCDRLEVTPDGTSYATLFLGAGCATASVVVVYFAIIHLFGSSWGF